MNTGSVQFQLRPRPWDEEGCFALDYLPREDPNEPRRDLIRRLKLGDQLAIWRAAHLLAPALEDRIDPHKTVLIPIPGHLPRTRPTGPELICRQLVRLLRGTDFLPNVIVRTAPIRSSATAAVRPALAEHLGSLGCTGLLRCDEVVLVDDVFTVGRTSAACRELLIDAGARRVLIACVARTRGA